MIAANERPEDEGDSNLPREGIERGAKSVRQTRGPHDQLLERLKERRIGIGSVKPILVPAQDPAAGKLGQLPLDRACAAASPADDLPQVK